MAIETNEQGLGLAVFADVSANNLHPSCPECRHKVAETDKFCPVLWT
jgi:hypothetical protein